MVWLAAVAGLSGCAGMGTKAELHRPELARNVRMVALWPVRIIGIDHRNENAAELADSLAAEEGIGALVEGLDELADSVLAEEASEFFPTLDPRDVWEASPDSSLECYPDTCTAQFEACAKLEADAFLHTQVHFRGGQHGENAYVVMRLFDVQSHALMAEVKYNTMWGNSYFSYPRIERTVPDGVRGAIKGMGKRIKRGY